MREREFWRLVDEIFGRAYGRSLARDLHLDLVDNRTPVEALASGVEPRIVWNRLCDQMEIPVSRRWGKNRPAPPLPPLR